jgi:ubiquinone/menaquinone biosynthesis C-methylase UbiE
MMSRIDKIGYGITCPLELIELTEAKRIDTIEADFLSSFLCTLKGRRILDLCAGTGRLSLELVKRKAIVFALDGSHTMAQIIKRRTEQLPDSIKNKLTLLFGDACELDYPSNIDLAIISDGSVGYFYNDGG